MCRGRPVVAPDVAGADDGMCRGNGPLWPPMSREQPKSRPCRGPLYAARVPTIRESESIKDVLIVEPDRHGDERGVFIETYRRSWFPLGREMVQGNRADRAAGAIVGLHYHVHQADYWTVPRGRAGWCYTTCGRARRRTGPQWRSTSTPTTLSGSSYLRA